MVPIAVLGGVLLGTAFSLEWAWLGAFAGVAALAWSLERAESLSAAAFIGVAFGWSGYVAGFFWLQPALASFWEGRFALSWAVWLVWGVWVALRFVVVAAAFRMLRTRGIGVVASLTFPWVAVEWLYPSVFPFFLANPLIDQTWIAQAASLGGPLLVSAWACAVSALVAGWASALARRGRVSRTEWSTVLIGTIALVGHGVHAQSSIGRQLRDADTVTVGIVQANVDVMQKRTERALSHRRYVERSRSLISKADVDLLVWPETSYLYALPRTLPLSGAAVLTDLEVPLLFGGIRRDEEGKRFNSALVVGSDGMIRSAYDKRFLIPFAEFVPFGDRFAWWADNAPTLSRFAVGEALAAVELGDLRIATPICYETIRPRYVRALVRESHPQLLVSLTNDGWFGDSPEPRIHLRLARFRAIEHRRFLVRATNTGISAVIDPLGRVLEQGPLFESASIVAEVRLLDRETLYGSLGDFPGYASTLAALLLVFARRKERLKPSS